MKKYLLILFLLILPSFSSLLRTGFFPMQDHMQSFRVYQMFRCFQDLQLPCRWVPDLGQGFGYPLFIYYAPGPYYLGALLSFVFQYIDTVKILFVLGFVFSAVSMYLLAWEIYKNKISALLSSLLYIYLPFRAVQVYVRGSLSEFLALVFFPLIFLFFYRLAKNGQKKDLILSSLSLAGLIITHNLMSYLFFPLLLVWIVVSIHRRYFLQVCLSLLLAFGLSAFFLLPLVYERQLVHLETLVGGYFGYQQHFVSLYRLFISNVWGYGSSAVDAPDQLNLSVGLIHWVVAFIASIYAFLKRNKTFILLGLIELFILFLMHIKSSFVWSTVPQLSYLQFPWRLLAISGFITSLLAGYIIHRKFLLIGLFILLIILHGSFFKPKSWLNYSDANLFTTSEIAREQTTSIYDYLPRTAAVAPATASTGIPVYLLGSGIIIDYHTFSNHQQGTVEVNTSSARLQLPIYAFYGNQVYVDDQPVAYEHSSTGQIEISLPSGKHDIEVRVTSTSDRRLGDIVSILSLFALSILALI